MKGSANLFCAKRVHDAALSIELQVRDKGLEEMEPKFQRLQVEVDALLQAIRDFVAATSDSPSHS